MFILRPQPLKRCHLAVLPGSERERENSVPPKGLTYSRRCVADALYLMVCSTIACLDDICFIAVTHIPYDARFTATRTR